MKGHSRMKLIYTFVIAAAILLGFSALSSTVSLNGRYQVVPADVHVAAIPEGGLRLLDTRTGDVWEMVTGGDGYIQVKRGPSE